MNKYNITQKQRQGVRNRLQGVTFWLVASVLLLLASTTLVFASNITEADYYGVITVSNNSTTSTNVGINCTINTGSMISQGFLNSGANNCAVQNTSGADIAFMPSVNASYPWCFWVPSIGTDSYLSYLLYTGNVSGGKVRYFPGSGGMITLDSESLEPSENFTIELKGWVDTTTGADKNLINKQNVRLYVSDTVSENITASIGAYLLDEFSIDLWADIGANVGVNVGTGRLEYDVVGADARSSRDLGAGLISDTEWTMDFTFYPDTADAGTAIFAFGLFDALGNFNGFPTDAVYMQINDGVDCHLGRFDGGGQDSVGPITIALDNTYYVTLERTSATEAKLSIFTDAARTTHTAGSPKTLAIPNTIVNLRYAQASSYTGATQASKGWFDDLRIDSEVVTVTATGVASGEHSVTLTANTTHMWLDIDGSTEDTVALSGTSVPDNSANWTFLQNDVMPYMEYQDISVNGTQVQYIDWEYGTTFNDTSGYGNDATPSFRITSSDADVSAELTLFQPIAESKAPAWALDTTPSALVSTTITTTGTFATTPSPTSAPFIAVIEAVSNATSTPSQLPFTIIAGFVILAASLGVSHFMRRNNSNSLIIKLAVIMLLFGIFIAVDIFDFWMLIFFLIPAVAIIMLKAQGQTV